MGKCSPLHFYYVLISVQLEINTAETAVFKPRRPHEDKGTRNMKRCAFCLGLCWLKSQGSGSKDLMSKLHCFPQIQTRSSITSHDALTEFLIYIK